MNTIGMSATDLKTIRINGEPRETAAANIGELLATLNHPVQSLLVEHNGLALRRDEWPERIIAAGDHVEIVRIVAGG